MTDRSPFQIAAPGLRQRGYSVIPLALAQKYPVIRGWQEYCTRLPTVEEHNRWMDWKAGNIGVCLGPASGIMALDFDDDVNGLHAGILAIIPDSPVKKRGAKGFTAFYRFNGERNQGYSVDGVRVLDVLAAGKQTVLPPSRHPNGAAYQWITPLTLADLAADHLPEVPPGSMRLIGGLFRPDTHQQDRKSYHEPYHEAGAQEITEALRFIPADDYDVWIRIGMALRQHLGDKGLPMWDQWSSTSSKYNSAEMTKRWRSFRRSDVTIATLFYMAMDRGYVHQHHLRERPMQHTIVIEEGGNLKPVKTSPLVMPVDAPGLVGRIASWINDTAIYPQPILALAAAIACTGAIMAHKIQSPTQLRTNFYTLGLAPSGAGKDHARKCIVNLLRYSGLDGILGGEPASSAGLLTAIREGGGKCLIQWDEFGRVLKNLTHRNAASHQSDILRAMVELFSCSGSIYAGVQYADHDGKMKRKPIDQPCLSIYGTTVPENFFLSLTHSDSIDGFLARFLVMESTEYTLKSTHPHGNINDPPESLLNELRLWKDAPSNYDPKGNIDGVLRICPMVVSYDLEAEELISAYTERMRAKVIEESKKRSGTSSIFARCAEHAIKLALAAHEGDSIDAKAMQWGIATADWCAAYLIDAISRNVAQNDFERASKKIHAIIADGKGDWIRHSIIVRRTQELGVKIRAELLSNLSDAGWIEVNSIKPEGGGRPAQEYRSLTPPSNFRS